MLTFVVNYSHFASHYHWQKCHLDTVSILLVIVHFHSTNNTSTVRERRCQVQLYCAWSRIVLKVVTTKTQQHHPYFTSILLTLQVHLPLRAVVLLPLSNVLKDETTGLKLPHVQFLMVCKAIPNVECVLLSVTLYKVHFHFLLHFSPAEPTFVSVVDAICASCPLTVLNAVL